MGARSSSASATILRGVLKAQRHVEHLRRGTIVLITMSAYVALGYDLAIYDEPSGNYGTINDRYIVPVAGTWHYFSSTPKLCSYSRVIDVTRHSSAGKLTCCAIR